MSRRWQLTITAVAVLSVFIALVAGSSLRPPLGAAALPEPAAWTQHTDDVATHAGEAQRHSIPELVSHQGHVSKGSIPADKKPFRNTWMTKDRPASWTHWSPQSGFSVLPASFASSQLQPHGHTWPVCKAAPDIRDISTRLCVVRC